MANAKKCDRCKKLYDETIYYPKMIINGSRENVFVGFGSCHSIDLCLNCSKKLERFLNELSEEELE